MQNMLPGTTIEITRFEKGEAEFIFRSIFAGGGVVLSQVSAMTALEPYIIQNWVRRGFLSSPDKRTYSKEQFSRIVIINMLKETLQLDRIIQLLSYINGSLTDTRDDIINDSQLYFYYTDLVAVLGGVKSAEDKELDAAIDEALCDYAEVMPGAKKRIKNVLKIMIIAHYSAHLRREAESLLLELT